jgi:hypothetical protein
MPDDALKQHGPKMGDARWQHAVQALRAVVVYGTLQLPSAMTHHANG